METNLRAISDIFRFILILKALGRWILFVYTVYIVLLFKKKFY